MSRRCRFFACLVAYALALPAGSALAELKDWGNRVEGTVDRPQHALDYELLGFYGCRQNYPLRDDVNLRLRFYLPETRQFFVTVREIKVDQQYLMQPKPDKVARNADGWREFAGWPVSDVLKRKMIYAENLGAIVRLDRSGEDAEDLRPAVLIASQPPSIEEYVLYLTVHRKLRSLDYQISGVSGYSKAYRYKAGQKDRSVEGGTVIPIRFTARQFPSGPATLHIEGPYANDLTAQPLSVTYRFYHAPL